MSERSAPRRGVTPSARRAKGEVEDVDRRETRHAGAARVRRVTRDKRSEKRSAPPTRALGVPYPVVRVRSMNHSLSLRYKCRRRRAGPAPTRVRILVLANRFRNPRMPSSPSISSHRRSHAQILLRGVDLIEDDEGEHGGGARCGRNRWGTRCKTSGPPDAIVFPQQSRKPLNGMDPSGRGFCF